MKSIEQFLDHDAKNISEYGVLRIHADGYALNNIEEKWPIFKVNLVMLEFHWKMMV